MLFGGDWTPQSSAENMTGCLGTVSLLFLVCVFNTHGLSEGAPLFPQKNLGHLTLLFQAIESVFLFSAQPRILYVILGASSSLGQKNKPVAWMFFSLMKPSTT